MAKFYDELDPEMADITVDGMVAALPADANWLEFFYFQFNSINRPGS